MRSDQQERRVRICPENPGKRFGRLRPDIAETAKLGQQRGRYRFAAVGVDRRDKGTQDGSLPFRFSRR